MGGWALPIGKYQSTVSIPTHPTQRFSASLENALVTSGRRVSRENKGAADGAAHIYNVEYIKQCESHAFCHIPVLNQLPLGILASLNSAPIGLGACLQKNLFLEGAYSRRGLL